MKIEGSGSASGSASISQRHGPADRIRIRIHTKMSWIRNTAQGDGDVYSRAAGDAQECARAHSGSGGAHPGRAGGGGVAQGQRAGEGRDGSPAPLLVRSQAGGKGLWKLFGAYRNPDPGFLLNLDPGSGFRFFLMNRIY
jgi:hypothetical protein